MQRYSVRLLPSAYEDLQTAVAWYKQHNINLPGRFIEQVDVAMRSIGHNPFAFAVRYKSIRIANLAVFPYGVHYFINESDKEVIVVGVFHTSLSPETWKR